MTEHIIQYQASWSSIIGTWWHKLTWSQNLKVFFLVFFLNVSFPTNDVILFMQEDYITHLHFKRQFYTTVTGTTVLYTVATLHKTQPI